jgi:hypothetical protein
MTKQVDQKKSVMSVVQIEDIRLVDLNTSTTIHSAESGEGLNCQLQYSTRIGERRETTLFFVLATIELQLLPKQTSESVVASVRATYELRYRLPEGFEATFEDLEAFAQVNGAYNAWPYWRELIQNIFTRMNLSPVILPLFRVVKSVETHDDK